MDIKKKLMSMTAVLLGAALLAGCGGGGASSGSSGSASKAGGKAFAPSATINWMCTSSPGGGSDIFSRQISDGLTKAGLVNGQNIVISNKTDGAGEVGRNEVATTKGKKADLTLLTFNSGDLMPMVKNTKNRASNFKIIAIMAVDKQLLFKGAQTKYADFKAAIEAAKGGTQVIIGGSKGDDVATYEALLKELGLNKDQLNFITYNSTGEAITAQLGGHVDFVMAKPAAASEYVASGDLKPVLALSKSRFTGNLADAPKLSEVGSYKDVEVPVWRGVAGPAAMSDAAVAFWSEQMKKISESEEWKKDYIEKYKLIPDYKDSKAATEYVTQYEKDYLASIGK